MKYTVHVRLKPDVADAQGRAVAEALQASGFNTVADVRVGKLIDLHVADGTSAEQIHAMCRALLVNGVIETYSIA